MSQRSSSDWFILRNPPREWILRVADVPGFRWHFHPDKTVSAVEWHLTHSELMPLDCVHGNLAPTTRDLAIAESAYVNAQSFALREYQREDLPLLYSRRASLLAYEMRLGKTAVAACAHNEHTGHPLVIVGPLIARDVWSDWVTRVHGNSPINLIERGGESLPGFPAYFCHYDVLDAHAGFLASLLPATVVFDEIHMLQSRRSQRMSGASLLASATKRVIGLSGTPMWTQPRSLWPILNLLTPGAWGTEFEFCQRYTNAKQTAYGWQYTGIANEDELKLRLRSLVIRRTWESVTGQLPQVTNIVEAVDVNQTDRNRIESLSAKLQLIAHASGKRVSEAGQLATLRRLFGQIKIKRVLELARDACANGHKVVMWTWHNDLQAQIHKDLRGMLIPTLLIAESQSQDDRERNRMMFMSDVGPAVLCNSIAVGGSAIDLSNADVNIFAELDWVPANIYQATMRVFKPGRPHSNIFLFADVPVERRLVEVLECNEACQTAAGLGYSGIAEKVLA